MSSIGVRPHRWSRQQYERMIASGIFEPGDQVELLDGEIVVMTPQGSLHATAVGLLEAALRTAFGASCYVRAQLPLALGAASEPEPDIAVVRGGPRDYRDAHPGSAELVAEVADASLAYDRERKAPLYAAAGISEYWILNLIDGQLEVYRGPSEGGYAVRETFDREAWVAPLLRPAARIRVADLLP